MYLIPPGGIILMVSTHSESVGWPGEEEASVSSAEEKNNALARRFLEAQTKCDLAAMDEMMASDFVDLSLLPGQAPDREGFKRSVVENMAPFSDISITIDEQVAEGDKVTTWYTGIRTHDRGPYMGVAPTGRRNTFTRVVHHRIVGGKIVEERSQGDVLNIMLPALEQQMRERERVEQELRVARRIQQASLPKEVPELEGWEIAPRYQPAREVGGDFYDFHLLSEGRVGLVVGDATGKGVPAALVMSTTLGMLQLAAQALGSSSPGEVLERVNEALTVRIPSNMFVTCFYAILDPKSGSLTFANAGHDLPYLHHNSEAKELRARGMPLGLMSSMDYEEMDLVLEAGESVLFYSDGLVEAHNPQREMFGFPRLRTLLAEHAEERSLGDFLMEELYSFVGEGWEQEDDITLVTLRCYAPLSCTSENSVNAKFANRGHGSPS
jgi:serine phosphatase RsbU (regulator of sigma subunit)/predicted ester cyclase